VNCVYTGFNPTGEVQLIKDITGAIPSAKVFGGDGVCSEAITNPKQGGIPASLASHFFCTVATLDLTAYPGGRSFLDAYKAKYGVGNPDPYAIYGYEAMKLGLDTIKSLGSKGNDRAAVLSALFAIKARHSVLGTYGFDSNGDTTLTKYGFYGVGSDGNPKFLKAVG
jgi:branched-chain amino acid transport system substrate-binding protein